MEACGDVTGGGRRLVRRRAGQGKGECPPCFACPGDAGADSGAGRREVHQPRAQLEEARRRERLGEDVGDVLVAGDERRLEFVRLHELAQRKMDISRGALSRRACAPRLRRACGALRARFFPFFLCSQHGKIVPFFFLWAIDRTVESEFLVVQVYTSSRKSLRRHSDHTIATTRSPPHDRCVFSPPHDLI